jgi:lysophospholipase L1-like esterase
VLGDSITEGGGYQLKAEWFFMTRIPTRPGDVITGGIRGDMASGANQHFISDCLDSKPTAVSVLFGRNDVWRSVFEYQESPDFAKETHKRAESYERDMSPLTSSLLASGMRAIFIKPSLLDETAVSVSREFQLRSIPAISPVNPEVENQRTS